MMYRLYFDMTKSAKKLKGFRLKEFGQGISTIEVSARNPDDACYKGFKMLEDIIFAQDSTVETLVLVKDVINDIKIFWVEKL